MHRSQPSVGELTAGSWYTPSHALDVPGLLATHSASHTFSAVLLGHAGTPPPDAQLSAQPKSVVGIVTIHAHVPVHAEAGGARQAEAAQLMFVRFEVAPGRMRGPRAARAAAVGAHQANQELAPCEGCVEL